MRHALTCSLRVGRRPSSISSLQALSYLRMCEKGAGSGRVEWIAGSRRPREASPAMGLASVRGGRVNTPQVGTRPRLSADLPLGLLAVAHRAFAGRVVSPQRPRVCHCDREPVRGRPERQASWRRCSPASDVNPKFLTHAKAAGGDCWQISKGCNAAAPTTAIWRCQARYTISNVGARQNTVWCFTLVLSGDHGLTSSMPARWRGVSH